jgi:hypothetical protein
VATIQPTQSFFDLDTDLGRWVAPICHFFEIALQKYPTGRAGETCHPPNMRWRTFPHHICRKNMNAGAPFLPDNAWPYGGK